MTKKIFFTDLRGGKFISDKGDAKFELALNSDKTKLSVETENFKNDVWVAVSFKKDELEEVINLLIDLKNEMRS